jgi:hypothetical protein
MRLNTFITLNDYHKLKLSEWLTMNKGLKSKLYNLPSDNDSPKMKYPHPYNPLGNKSLKSHEAHTSPNPRQQRYQFKSHEASTSQCRDNENIIHHTNQKLYQVRTSDHT